MKHKTYYKSDSLQLGIFKTVLGIDRAGTNFKCKFNYVIGYIKTFIPNLLFSVFPC